ncbi:UNVERIFIED_CONTAM: hypothetical protein Scaly_3139300 [Sesamum calycinum]|uniref:Uncharacterized protein n=1 Tax=Sesamum calycinum TaxID=2727403 RepID=A0AAW2JGH4_9LAMI
MTWHANNLCEEGSMEHPSHGDAWKHFDRTHPPFASDARNVRLGLCTDGFSPFDNSNVKDKTKDNIKTRKDLELYCSRHEMHLFEGANGKVYKPKASYTLSKTQKKRSVLLAKSLKLPDGHSLSIARGVNEDECKFYGMKSHLSCIHAKILPIAFSDLLLKPIWEALTELGMFFRDICSTVLWVEHMEQLETNIVEILCKFEKIFPLGFSTQWSTCQFIWHMKLKLVGLYNIDGFKSVEPSVENAFQEGEASNPQPIFVANNLVEINIILDEEAEEVNSVEFEALRHAMDSYPTKIGDEEHDEEEEFEEIESEEDSQDDEDHNSSDSDKDDDMEIDD